MTSGDFGTAVQLLNTNDRNCKCIFGEHISGVFLGIGVLLVQGHHQVGPGIRQSDL